MVVDARRSNESTDGGEIISFHRGQLNDSNFIEKD